MVLPPRPGTGSGLWLVREAADAALPEGPLGACCGPYLRTVGSGGDGRRVKKTLLRACLCPHPQALSEKGFNVEYYKNIAIKLASLE